MLAGILLRCLLGVSLDAQNEPAGQGLWPAAHSRAPTPDRPWPLMMGVISRETAGHARRQRLRAHYRQVPDVLVRFVVSEAFASRGGELGLLGVPDGLGSSVTYKSLYYWLLVTTLYDARYYLKTDDDAVLSLPVLLDLLAAADTAAARDAPPGAPPLVLAGDINWGTFDLQALEGHCWSTRAAHSLGSKHTQCPLEFGPVPFATGALILLSKAVAVQLRATLGATGWLKRADLNSYFEDRLIGLAVSRDSRPVHLLYLNPYDHYDASAGTYDKHVRAISGQRPALFELEGPGGLLISHHVRGAAAFAAAAAAQQPNVQRASALRLHCKPFNASIEGASPSGFPAPLRAWHSCTLDFEYAVARPQMGYCAATIEPGDCARGVKGGWNSTALGIADLAGCAARCAQCARCRYVSFSPLHEDCSWFHACELADLRMRWAGYTYETAAVTSNAPRAPA